MAASMKYVPCESTGGKDGLILANFCHGRLNIADDGSCYQPPAFTYYTHSDKTDVRKNKHRMLVAETDSMEYVGQNYGTRAPQHSSSCRYFVGIRDKTSGKMKVHDAQSFHLRPWFGDGKDEVDRTTKEPLTYAEKADRLTEAFGSSRKQRALESRLRNVVSTEALETLASKAVVHAKAQPQSRPMLQDKDADISSIIPPYNASAQSLKDVYNLDDIIPPPCMEMLQAAPEISAMVEAKTDQMDGWKQKYCNFIRGHIPATSSRQDACILLYMHWLTKLYGIKHKAKHGETVTIGEGISTGLNQHLLRTFTQTSATVDGVRVQRVFSKKSKEKVLLWLLVLALFLDDYKTDLGLLQKSTGAPLTTFRNLARVLGCKVKVSGPKTSPTKRKHAETEVKPSVGNKSVRKEEQSIFAELCLPSKFKRGSWKPKK